MFTGIVTDIGRIVETKHTGDLRARIATGYDVTGIDIGASIACDGVCLTVVALGGQPEGWFDVEISGETVSKTNLGGWGPGKRVNLERALKVGDELGGHIVSGHVDGLAEVVSVRPEGGSVRVTVPRARGACAVHRAQGVGGTERHLADGERGGGCRVRGELHSPYTSRDDLGRGRRGRPGEPGGRHDGPLCGAAAGI
jgi:hypothetical protein